MRSKAGELSQIFHGFSGLATHARLVVIYSAYQVPCTFFFFFFCQLPQHAEVPGPGIDPTHSSNSTESLMARPPGNSALYSFFFLGSETCSQSDMSMQTGVLGQDWTIGKAKEVYNRLPLGMMARRSIERKDLPHSKKMG